jgi:hypothetical protein
MSQIMAWRHKSGTQLRGAALVSLARRAGLLACCAVPVLLFPESEVPLGWLLVGAGYAIGCGAWLHVSPGPRITTRFDAPFVTWPDVVRAGLVAYAATIGAFALITGPLLLLLWPIDPRLGSLAVVAGLAILPRTLLTLPALVAGDDATTAFDRAWAWAGAAPVRATITVCALLLVAIGPAVAASAWAGGAGHAGLSQRVLAVVALALTGGTLPVGLATLAARLDSRCRRVDPRFGRA